MSKNLLLTPIMMTTTVTLTLARHPMNLTTHFAWAPLTSVITQTLKPNNTVTVTTPNWMHNPQLGVANYCHQEISFLDNEEKKQKLFTQGTKHCKLLHSMSQTYCDLTSSNEPDIFDINKD